MLDRLNGVFWGAICAGGISVLLWSMKRWAFAAIKIRKGEEVEA